MTSRSGRWCASSSPGPTGRGLTVALLRKAAAFARNGARSWKATRSTDQGEDAGYVRLLRAGGGLPSGGLSSRGGAPLSDAPDHEAGSEVRPATSEPEGFRSRAGSDGLDALDVGEELPHGPFHPPVQRGLGQRAAGTATSQLDLQHLAIEGHQANPAAVVVLDVGADHFQRALAHAPTVERRWRGCGFQLWSSRFSPSAAVDPGYPGGRAHPQPEQVHDLFVSAPQALGNHLRQPL